MPCMSGSPLTPGGRVKVPAQLPAADSGVVEGIEGWRGSAKPLSTNVLFGPMELRVKTQMPLGRLLVSKRNTASPDCCVPREPQEDSSPERFIVTAYAAESCERGAMEPWTVQPPMRPDSAPRADTVITQLPPNTPVPR